MPFPGKPPILGGLRPHERCLLMRRRTGTTQEQVAKELGCSRYWVRLMEQGQVNCDRLIWYWEC